MALICIVKAGNGGGEEEEEEEILPFWTDMRMVNRFHCRTEKTKIKCIEFNFKKYKCIGLPRKFS